MADQPRNRVGSELSVVILGGGLQSQLFQIHYALCIMHYVEERMGWTITGAIIEQTKIDLRKALTICLTLYENGCPSFYQLELKGAITRRSLVSSPKLHRHIARNPLYGLKNAIIAGY